MSEEELGRGFLCDYDEGHLEREKVMAQAIHDAKAELPEGTAFEIRSKVLPKDCSTDYNRTFRNKRYMAENWGIAWYCVLEGSKWEPTPTEPLFQNDVDEGQPDELGGFILIARMVA